MAENSSLNCHGQDQDDDFVVVHSSPQSNGNFTNLVDICACDVCKDSNVAVSCCTSCAELLCKLCTEHHMKNSPDHMLMCLRTNSAQLYPVSMCTVHPNKRQKMFCETCATIMCSICAKAVEHVTHTVGCYADSLEQHQRALLEIAHAAQAKVESLEKCIGVHDTTLGKLNEKEVVAIESVNTAVDTIIKAANYRRDVLLQSVHKLAAEAEEPISKSRQATAKALLNVADMLRNLDSETAWKSTLINISKVIDLEKGIRDAIQFFENTDWQLPDTVARISCDPTSISNTIASFGAVEGLTSPEMCIATGDGLSLATEGEFATFSVVPRDYKGRRLIIGGESVEISVRNSLFSPLIVKGPIENTKVGSAKDGSYRVAYELNKNSGKKDFDLSVTIGGKNISGSPFKVSITQPVIWGNGSTMFTKLSQTFGWDAMMLSRIGWTVGVHTFDVVVHHLNKKDPDGMVIGVAPRSAFPVEYDKYPGITLRGFSSRMRKAKPIFSMPEVSNALPRIRVVLDCDEHTVFIQFGDRAYAGKLPLQGSGSNYNWHIAAFLHYPGDAVELSRPIAIAKS